MTTLDRPPLETGAGARHDSSPGCSRRELLAWGALAAAAGRILAHSTAAAPAAGELHRRPIPSTGETVPIVGLGTYRVLDVEPAGYPALEPVLAAFVAAGARVVDTSPMYGRAEAALGALAERLGVRDRLFLATKVWTEGREAGIRQMEESFRLLRTRRIDLFQVHNLLDADLHLPTLAGWKKEGRIGAIGITHYVASAHGELAARIRAGGVDVVQVNYSIAEREAERELLPLALRSGVAVLANRPFVAGRLFTRLGERALPAWLAERGVATWAQAMLKWVLGHPAVTCAIPATSKVHHLEENLAAGRGWLPNESERARLATELEAALAL
jgi:diketogulonate reductase-like aldo/keto reductase